MSYTKPCRRGGFSLRLHGLDNVGFGQVMDLLHHVELYQPAQALLFITDAQ